MKPVLLDTGVIVALLDRRQRAHSRCVDILATLTQPPLTCEAVIAESCHILSHVHGASEAVLANINSGIFKLSFDLSKSSESVRILLHKYRDTPADFADACLIQMADEQGTGEILTLDSDFEYYRWRRNKPFHFLIPLE